MTFKLISPPSYGGHVCLPQFGINELLLKRYRMGHDELRHRPIVAKRTARLRAYGLKIVGDYRLGLRRLWSGHQFLVHQALAMHLFDEAA